MYCSTHNKCSNITPRQLILDKETFEAPTPVLPYITLEQGKQEEFRVEVKRLIKQDQNNRRQANISKEEFKALRELKMETQQVNLDQGQGGSFSCH